MRRHDFAPARFPMTRAAPLPGREAWPWRRRPDWTVLPPPDPRLQIVVIVPVRNEAAGLPATLACLAAQRGLDGRRFARQRYEIIVLANNCSDDSAGVVRRFAARRPGLRLHVVEVRFPRSLAHVGHARASLMDEARRRVAATAGGAGIIASTDGDTRVAPDWLAATWLEIAGGADAVGGRIELAEGGEIPRGLARLTRRDETYQRLRSRLEHVVDPDPADPWPRHHQHFGASLAVSAEAYARVGGLPAEPFLEDEAFYRALRAHDMKVRHSEAIRVVTSNRRDGRVAVGLSWQLREWEALAAAQQDARVMDPEAWCAELQLRRRLRECWQAARAMPAGRRPEGSGRAARCRPLAPAVAARVERLAARLAVPPVWLAARLAASETYGVLWASVLERRDRRGAGSQPAQVPMREAIAALRRLIGRHAPRPH